MNYYEELDVSPAASPEEIKDAYRTAMRLVHPDRQTDPRLRRLAEQQARKLNQIYDVLSDPERRRRYDDELAFGRPVIIAPPVRPRVVNRHSAAWTGAVVLFLAAVAWMASRQVTVSPPPDAHDSGAQIAELPTKPPAGTKPEPPTPEPTPTPTNPPNSAPPAESKPPEDAALRSKLAEVLGERDKALAELEREKKRNGLKPDSRAERTKPAESKPAESKPAESKPAAFKPTEPKPASAVAAPLPVVMAENRPPASLAPPTPSALLTSSTPAPAAPASPLLGNWTWKQVSTANKSKELYPPEFIETRISEQNGELHGTYRARYKIPIPTIPPDVDFQFSGKLTGDSGRLAWTGPAGARGELTLKLMADHSLRVDWTATQIGSLGFYKGTAVLVKKTD